MGKEGEGVEGRTSVWEVKEENMIRLNCMKFSKNKIFKNSEGIKGQAIALRDVFASRISTTDLVFRILIKNS